MTSKMKNLPKNENFEKIETIYKKSKIDPKIPPNDLKNEKFTKKIKIFEKNDFFLNLQTIYKKIKN